MIVCAPVCADVKYIFKVCSWNIFMFMFLQLHVNADISSYTSFKEAQVSYFFTLSVSIDVRYLTVHDKCN